MKETKQKKNYSIIFWAVLLAIGMAAIITGAVLIAKTHNNLLWLIISLGLILVLVSLLLTVYLYVIKRKQKSVRKDISSKGI